MARLEYVWMSWVVNRNILACDAAAIRYALCASQSSEERILSCFSFNCYFSLSLFAGVRVSSLHSLDKFISQYMNFHS